MDSHFKYETIDQFTELTESFGEKLRNPAISSELRKVLYNYYETIFTLPNLKLFSKNVLNHWSSVPICFITMKLWRSYAVTAIALWPVIAENCDVVTRNYDEKIAVTRSYGEKITVTHNYVQVFRNYGSQWRRNWYKIWNRLGF